MKSKGFDRKFAFANKENTFMRQLNVSMLFVCFAALLFVFACADPSKKEAETSTQTAEASIEEVTLTVTGMT